MNLPLLEGKKLCKQFLSPEGTPLSILDQVDIQVFPGEVLAIIGPSGCGKSTLLRILAGLIPPSSGTRFYQGKPHHGLLPHTALVFQHFALYPWMTVSENISVVLEAASLSEKEITQRTLESISMVGLMGFENAYPKELSGGMKQRVGLARALACHPQLLFLDEPFSALDVFTAEVLREELLTIWAQKKPPLRAIVLISHDIREVAFLADRIIMMRSHPGQVQFIKPNALPRPRDYHAPEFLQLVDALHDAYSQPEPAPPSGAAPLIPASPEEILSLLSYLHRFRKTRPLSQLGTGSMDHFHILLRNAIAAKQLKLAKVTDHSLSLTEKGKEYLAANHEHRRMIWQEQLLQLPIFSEIVHQLKAAPKHTLSHRELIELCTKLYPGLDPLPQCKILIQWGSYGQLFTYHKVLRTVSLP